MANFRATAAHFHPIGGGIRRAPGVDHHVRPAHDRRAIAAAGIEVSRLRLVERDLEAHAPIELRELVGTSRVGQESLRPAGGNERGVGRDGAVHPDLVGRTVWLHL